MDENKINISDSPLENNDSTSDQNQPTDESNLKVVANVIMVTGPIISVIIFFSIANITVPATEYSPSQTIFNWAGFAYALTTLSSFIGLSYFLKVISNISISLKEISKNK